MVGITAYGAYIPWHRLSKQLAAKTWNGFAGPGERSVAYYDEDSITMAVAAAQDCLAGLDEKKVDGLFFATTTSPYKEKLGAALIAMPLDLRREIRTADVTGSLRAGASALAMAADAVAAGSAGSILVTAADMRLGAPNGPIEQQLGDGAAALLVGKDNVVAEIQAAYSISDELAGNWRADSDTFVRSWEDRMVLDTGWSVEVPAALIGLMKKCGLGPDKFTKLVLDFPSDARRLPAAAAAAGFQPAQIQDAGPVMSGIGLTGCALAPMMLVAALESAKPGDRIMYACGHNGADAFALQVTDNIKKLPPRRGLSKHIESRQSMGNYVDYLRWREIVPQEAGKRPDKQHIKLSAIWRERKQLLGLYGVKCRKCGTPQYDNGSLMTTPIRVCMKCQARDDFEDYRFRDKKATVFSFTQDNLASVVDPPASVVVVDFEGGGRGMFDLTDRDPAKVEIGMPVEMTFRKLQFDRGLTNYFWKCRPLR